MIQRRPRWELKVTHEPSGISCVRNSDIYRNQHLARDAAIKYIRSRLFALKMSLVKDEDCTIEVVECIKIS